MELNKPGNFKTLLVDDTDFDPDAYGNRFYSVVFEGDAASHLWKAKEKPEVNKEYYGHFELSKSGKAQIFKRDKDPEGVKPSGKSEWKPKDERQITKNMVWKNLLNYYDIATMTPDSKQWQEFWAMVELHTDMLVPGDKPSLLDGAEPLPLQPPDFGDENDYA